MQTPFYPSFLSAASWSPTRPGVFFLCRHDGFLDTWDYFYRMNEVSLSQKVSDSALTSLSVQAGGSLAAVGDSDGVITLLQLCDGLVQMGPNEKNIIGHMFDRETKREKSLELIKKQGGGNSLRFDRVGQDSFSRPVTDVGSIPTRGLGSLSHYLTNLFGTHSPFLQFSLIPHMSPSASTFPPPALLLHLLTSRSFA